MASVTRRISLALARRWWLAAWIGLSLCALPLRLRRRALPALLQPRRRRRDGSAAMSADEIARVVRRVCRLPIFRLPLFPKACLRESLTLFEALTCMGHPASLHIGTCRYRDRLHAHSWIICEGRPLLPDVHPLPYRTLYSYANGVSHEKTRAAGRTRDRS